uniref:Uncharacterized protein n=1 Tax=Meloidogyne floridensis TaxID=298350 RepID=A0A915NG74_9BILA
MFEPTFEFPVKTGSAFLSNNLSVYNHKTKGQTYVQLLSWNEKMEQDCCELLSEEEIAKSAGEAGEKPICLMQIYVALPSNRSNIPVIIILAGTFVSIFDFITRKCLFTKQTSDPLLTCKDNKKTLKSTPFTRGISCVETCNSENNFQTKKNLKEHNSPITDIASCSFDLITVSGDVGGN